MVIPLERLWDRLCQVRALSFVARSASPTGWKGRGNGTVVVRPVGEGSITFTEAGVWQPEGGRDIRFHNVFRWSAAAGVVRLEHLRFGVNHPVYLFDLEPVADREWRSASPHQCSEDCYTAHMLVCDDHIALRWFVTGPRKQEEIDYTYSW